MEEKKHPVWPLALGAALILGLLVLGGYFLERSVDSGGQPPSGGKTVEEMLGITDEDAEAPVNYNGKWYVRNQDVEAYLVMGVDRHGEAGAVESYIGGGQADVQLLLVLDHQNKRCSLLQINRDTMTKVEVLGVMGDVVGSETAQIALAHGYGKGVEDSCENTVRAVSNLLYGMEIHGYAAIQMDAIPILNDMVGGVTVTIEDDFSEVDPTLVQGETVTLMGEQAMSFIRMRHYVGDGANLGRMRRHRAYLTAFTEQLRTKVAEEPDLVVALYDAALPYMITDMSGKTVSQVAEWCRAYESQGIVTIEGEAVQGEVYMEFYPDEDSLLETVIGLFYLEKSDENTGG